MKCKSCQEVVDPKFKHAISVNACPFCGQVIVDERLKEILAELAIIMVDATPYMEDVENWFQSNYSLQKIAEGQIVVNKEDLHSGRVAGTNPSGKVPTKFRRAGEDGDENDAEVAPAAPQTEFAKRAGVVVQQKKVIDFIRGGQGGAADPSEFVGEEEADSFVSNSGPPLRANEINQLSDVFANSGGETGPVPQIDKMQRLKAHSQGPKFSRG